MTTVTFILAAVVALVACHDHHGEEASPIAPSAPRDLNCGDVMEEVNVCMDQLHDSEDSKLFNARREEIFKKCVPLQTPQCAGQAAAIEKCQSQARADSALKKNREEVKTNVTKCYESYPNSRKTGGNRPSFLPNGPAGIGGGRGPAPFGAPPPPPQPQPGFGLGPDPCVPTGEQILCLKHSMDSDQNISAIGSRLRDQERQCFTKPNLVNCRPDNGQLRQCLDQAAQSFMLQVSEKIKKCVRDAGYELPPMPPMPPMPPHGFSG